MRRSDRNLCQVECILRCRYFSRGYELLRRYYLSTGANYRGVIKQELIIHSCRHRFRSRGQQKCSGCCAACDIRCVLCYRRVKLYHRVIRLVRSLH